MKRMTGFTALERRVIVQRDTDGSHYHGVSWRWVDTARRLTCAWVADQTRAEIMRSSYERALANGAAPGKLQHVRRVRPATYKHGTFTQHDGRQY